MSCRRKRTIEEQLHIAIPNNPNIPSRYARGLLSYQPQLFVEDPWLDNYNDTQALLNYRNAEGGRQMPEDSLNELKKADIDLKGEYSLTKEDVKSAIEKTSKEKEIEKIEKEIKSNVLGSNLVAWGLVGTIALGVFIAGKSLIKK